MEGAVEQPPPPIPLTPSNSMSAGPFALSRHARLAAGDVDVVTTSRWYFYTGPMPAPETPDDECRVFSGTANPELSAELASFLGRPLDSIDAGRWPDGEVKIEVNVSCRNKSVYIVQPCCGYDDGTCNDSLMELLLMVSTVRRSNPANIIVVLPYYAYSRRTHKPDVMSRVPISAADVAQMLTVVGTDRVVCVDLHCAQIQGFFPPSIPVDNLHAGPVGAVYFGEKGLGRLVVVSPDAGGVQRAKEFRTMLMTVTRRQVGVAMLIRQRSADGTEIESMELIGDVAGCACIIVDDEIVSAQTIVRGASAVRSKGASHVFAFATHGIFAGDAAARIDASALDEVVVSNTIPLKTDFKAALKRCPVHQLSLAPLLAETIKRLHLGQSISKLSTDFDPVARPTANSPMAPTARSSMQLHEPVVVRPEACSFAPISPPAPVPRSLGASLSPGPTGDAPLP